ncbi:DUF4268 domain-containing protein [uncultured Draconibacterium sp.]|uniref:DUF4268 domain-containing protein n=1 Tax=uncultured Draconibacterium sp. TaxID=1573823 RepID=UPI00321650A5
MNELGTLQKIDLRKVWTHEAHDFTQWLAEEEHIKLLVDELDIEIENIKPEASTGRYNVDIVADEVDTGKKVIIENQLEYTDHKHLGQLLTYASGWDASIIIWIVKDYREEHKQAIDWFNRHMPETISFFLVQIELWQIGTSKVAPKFNIVAQPNDWAKTVKVSGGQNLVSELKLQQQEFWTQFKEYANNNNTSLSLNGKAKPQHWYNINIGTSRAYITLVFHSKNNLVGSEVYIPKDDLLFQQLYAKKDKIEQLLGFDLDWQELPEKTASRIRAFKSCDPTNMEEWQEQFEWLQQTTEKLHKVFKKYI